MPEQHAEEDFAGLAEGETPLHGFRGHPIAAVPRLPASLTIAISREAGSRGAAIARRAGARLGWQVYSQDLLEYISQESSLRQDVLDHLVPEAGPWIEEELNQLLRQGLNHDPHILDLARMVLSLAAQGEAILLGRGAGYLLPPLSTLHVRLVAPVADRIAYTTQWLRLTEAEAAEQVRQRDRQRAEFLQTHFHRQASDVHQYDCVLNTSLLGEEICTELIVQAARAKMTTLLEKTRE